jgi:ankyrin repeat protein
MSTVSSDDLNWELFNAACNGDNDAVLAAIAAGSDVNRKNDSHVSDNDI